MNDDNIKQVIKFPYASIIFFILVFLGLVGFTIFVLHQKIISVRITEEELSKEQAKANEFKALKNLIKETANADTLLSAHILSTTEIVPFLEMLDTVGKNTTTDIVLTGASVEEAKPPLSKHVSITLTANGSFSNVYRALRAFESLPYAISIEKVSFVLNTKDTKIKADIWNLSLTFFVMSVE